MRQAELGKQLTLSGANRSRKAYSKHRDHICYVYLTSWLIKYIYSVCCNSMTLHGQVLYAMAVAVKADVKSVFAPWLWISLCHETDISDPVDQMAVNWVISLGDLSSGCASDWKGSKHGCDNKTIQMTLRDFNTHIISHDFKDDIQNARRCESIKIKVNCTMKYSCLTVVSLADSRDGLWIIGSYKRPSKLNIDSSWN